MRRKFTTVAAAIAAVVLMGGCGSNANPSVSGVQGTPISSESQESQPPSSAAQESQPSSSEAQESQTPSSESGAQESNSLAGLSGSQYVELGDYSSFAVKMNVVGVDEKELKELMSEWYVGYVTPEHGGIVNRAIAVGDTALIDFVGKLNGVAFEGGTAQNYPLEIGSGSFIAGFEDGLVGVMPGKTVDLNLTFPEGYGGDLSGKQVVFTVTVRCIQPKSVAENAMEDAVIVSMGVEGMNNVAGFRQYAHDYLQAAYDSEVQTRMLDILIERCKFQELPDDLYLTYHQKSLQMFSLEAANYQLTLDEYAQTVYQLSGADLVQQSAERYMKQDLIFSAIAEKEGLNVSDDELQRLLKEAASAAGSASVEAYLGGGSKEDFRIDKRNEKVLDFLMKRTKVSKAG